MCGSGRFLLPLLRAGVDINGVDAAPAMLEACRRRNLPDHPQPVLYLQALEELALPRKYQMAFVPAGSICLLAENALSAALSRISRHLEPGASLLIELVDPKAGEVLTDHVEQRVVQLDDEVSISYVSLGQLAADGASITYVGRYEKRRGSSLVASEAETLTLNLYAPGRFAALMATSGFRSVINHGSTAYASLGASGCVLLEANAVGMQ
jgi:SAM-dependent methyltransferase